MEDRKSFLHLVKAKNQNSEKDLKQNRCVKRRLNVPNLFIFEKKKKVLGLKIAKKCKRNENNLYFLCKLHLLNSFLHFLLSKLALFQK